MKGTFERRILARPKKAYESRPHIKGVMKNAHLTNPVQNSGGIGRSNTQKRTKLDDEAALYQGDHFGQVSITNDRQNANILQEQKLLKNPPNLSEKPRLDNPPAGVIFICNKRTMPLCFQYGLFALPQPQLKMVQSIVPGTKLFLFVVDSRELHGIFEATSQGGKSIQPKAFGRSFPSQVRFGICRECKPIAEKDFRNVIEENYFTRNKFRNELSSQQVLGLLKLFGHNENLGQNQESCLGAEERKSGQTLNISLGNQIIDGDCNCVRGSNYVQRNAQAPKVDCRYQINLQSHQVSRESTENFIEGEPSTVENLQSCDYLRAEGSKTDVHVYEGKDHLYEDKVSWGGSEITESQINMEHSEKISACEDIQKNRIPGHHLYTSCPQKEEKEEEVSKGSPNSSGCQLDMELTNWGHIEKKRISENLHNSCPLTEDKDLANCSECQLGIQHTCSITSQDHTQEKSISGYHLHSSCPLKEENFSESQPGMEHTGSSSNHNKRRRISDHLCNLCSPKEEKDKLNFSEFQLDMEHTGRVNSSYHIQKRKISEDHFQNSSLSEEGKASQNFSGCQLDEEHTSRVRSSNHKRENRSSEICLHKSCSHEVEKAIPNYSACQADMEHTGRVSSFNHIQKKRIPEYNLHNSCLWKEENVSTSSSNFSHHQPNMEHTSRISSSNQSPPQESSFSIQKKIVSQDYVNRRKHHQLGGGESSDKRLEWSPIRTDPKIYSWASGYINHLSQFAYPTKLKQLKY